LIGIILLLQSSIFQATISSNTNILIIFQPFFTSNILIPHICTCTSGYAKEKSQSSHRSTSKTQKRKALDKIKDFLLVAPI